MLVCAYQGISADGQTTTRDYLSVTNVQTHTKRIIYAPVRFWPASVALAPLPSGKPGAMIACRNQGTVTLFDAQKGNPLGVLFLTAQHSSDNNHKGLMFSRDGRLLAVPFGNTEPGTAFMELLDVRAKKLKAEVGRHSQKK